MYMRIIVIALFTLLSLMAFSQADYQVAAVGFYNVENLFFPEDDPLTRDEDFTPSGRNHYTTEIYTEKLQNLSKVVSQMGTEITPDGLSVLGVCEVENRKVLEDFVKEKSIRSRNYQILHYDSPDRRGIDVGLLYNPKYFVPDTSYNIRVDLQIIGVDYPTRDVLFVKGKLLDDEIHFLVNHWPSRSGGEAASAPRRKLAAQVNKHVVDSLLSVNPDAKVIIMGDLNDDPSSPSLNKVLKAKGNEDKLKKEELFNPMWSFYKKGIGTLAWQDSWNIFDHLIMTPSLLNKKQDGLFYYKTEIFNRLFLAQKTGRYKGYPFRTFGGSEYLGGYSDHFPVMVYLLKKK